MSEPDAGSDVASLRTRADLDEGGTWVINGSKVWTSGAAESDWCYLIARTDQNAAPHAGLSEFIVDLHAPGVEVRPIRDMTDDRHFCEVIFDDVRVDASMMVGNLNGAFKQIMRQMEHERGGIDRLVSNRRLYLDAVDAARSSGRLAADPLLRQEFARLEGGYRIGRSLVLREVLGQAPAGYSAVTKTWCTEFEQRVAEVCVSVSGPGAMIWGRTARNICYAPGYTIMGGTTQILRNIIGERLLGLPR
ncbi:MAG: acyl-CoA dehydrogenase family protein [Acidimicrobiales bacterium]